MPSADATWRSWDFKRFFMIKTTEQALYIIDLLINSMLTFRSRLNTTPHLRMLAWSTCADPESFVRGTPTLTFFCVLVDERILIPLKEWQHMPASVSLAW